MDMWSRGGYVGYVGQGWICGVGVDMWGRGGYVGQGWICGVGVDMWGRGGYVG